MSSEVQRASTPTESLDSRADFERGPRGEYARWHSEIATARHALRPWLNEADRATDRFIDRRPSGRGRVKRLNLFNSTVQAQVAVMHGNTPKVSVKRRFEDPQDDVGRVASSMMERLLNTDIESDDDDFEDVLDQSLLEWLIAGLGTVRLRYEVRFGQPREVQPVIGPDGLVQAEGYTQEVKEWEDILCDFVHHKDMLWSPARTWREVRWVAFRAHMARDDFRQRFPDARMDDVQFGRMDQTEAASEGMTDALYDDPWSRTQVWEIWSKADKRVYWWTEGHDTVLDMKDDPLKLRHFFPCPRPLISNASASELVPKPDYTLCEDQYNAIDRLETRIAMLVKAIQARGIYPGDEDEVKRLFQEAYDNDIIGIRNWAQFQEKGGLRNLIEWLPIDIFVQALDKLRELRAEEIAQLYQINGFSDLMRGAEGAGPARTATEQAMRARYGGVRMSHRQEEFARWTAAIQRIKAEMICNLFDDRTIMDRTMVPPDDQQLIAPALQLLRSDLRQWRVAIDSEQVSMTDYAALKEERAEFIQAVSGFVTGLAPVAEGMPGSMPYLYELLKWGLAGFRQSQDIEGTIDKLVDAVKQAEAERAMQPPEDDGTAKVQAEAQAKMAQTQADLQASLTETQAKTQAAISEEQAKLQMRMQELQREEQAAIQRLEAEARLREREISHELEADMRREQAQAAFNIEEQEAQADASIREKQALARIAVAENAARAADTARYRPGPGGER